jgi:hypothetical protein
MPCHSRLRIGWSALAPVLLVTLFATSSAVDARAQSTYGAVVGTVVDTTRAPTPGVTVTLTEVQTNVVRTGTARGDGQFEFLNITQGRYRLTAELAGFRTFTSEDFAVEARQTVRVDPVLGADAVSEQVTVRGSAPLINTETPTISGARSNRELQQLPFTFRAFNTSPLQAINTIPEVQKGSGFEFSLSGSLPYQNDVSVDGISTTNARRNGIGENINLVPSIEGVQEIRVSSVNNAAEFAQIGDITTVTRPGTNQFRGSIFWNYNDTGLNANPNYFNKGAALNKSENNNYGGYVAGPVLHNRTFFFATWERLDISRSATGTATVPESDFRTGNFSRRTTPLVDPLTGQPFPGNVIPASRLNAVAQKVLAGYMPLPNDDTGRVNRYTIDAPDVSNQFDVRVDQNFSPGHTLFGRYTDKLIERETATAYQVSGPRTERNPTRTLALSDNYALRGSLLNEARFGFSTSDLGPKTALRGRDFIADTGLILLSSAPPDITGSTYVDIAGYTRLGEAKEEPLTTRTIQLADVVTFIRGRHTIKGGFDLKNYNWTSPVNFTGADDYGVFRFRDGTAGGTGLALANFLLGIPDDVDQTATGPGVDGLATHIGTFVQDEWRVGRNVTLSLGVRYDLYQPFTDRQLNISNFLRDTPNGDVVVPNQASVALTSPGFRNSIGTSRILTADEAGLPESLRHTDTNNIAPRFGVAWRPFGDTRTVVRGGYGIYNTRVLGAVFNSLTGIHTSDNVTFTNAFDSPTRRHAIVWPNTYAGDANRGVSQAGTQNFSTANDPNYKDPRTQQWSATIERELVAQTAVRLTYSGLRSTDLTMAPDLNQIQPNTIGFANLPTSARPYPNWFRVNTRDNGGYKHYHDVTAQLRGRLSAGLEYNASYRWASAISNIEDRGPGSANFQTEINGRTDNRFDPDYLRGPDQATPTHRFVFTGIWDLPVGRDRAVGAGWSRALDAALGGWTLSTVAVYESGQHLSAYYGGHCGSGTNCYGSEKPDAVSGQDPNDGPQTLAQWFNTGAFSVDAFFPNGQPAFIGRFGTAAKGDIIGPSATSIDLALFKDVRFSANGRLRVSVQSTNVLNIANYGNPDTNVRSGNYGRITALNQNQVFLPRRIVLGVRALF